MTAMTTRIATDTTRILIVDDEEMAREGLGKLLRKDGYYVATATDGEHALDVLAKESIDLIITDLRMPKVDGMSLIRLVRERGFDGGIIVMTAYYAIDSYLEAIDSGAVEYINKPVRIDEIRAVIRHVLS